MSVSLNVTGGWKAEMLLSAKAPKLAYPATSREVDQDDHLDYHIHH